MKNIDDMKARISSRAHFGLPTGFVIGFCAMFFTNCTPWTVKNERTITALELRRTKAMIAADTNALSLCLADDLRFVHTNGVMENKHEFIDAIASGKYRFSTYALDSIQWRMSKKLASTHGSSHIVVFAYDKEFDIKTRYTAIYTYHRKQGWQLAGWQNTKI